MKDQHVPLKLLVPDPDQPRQDFEPKALAQLTKSIKEKGILVPIAVEKMKGGKFLLIDGERRYRAAMHLKLEKVPVIVYESMNEIEGISTRFHLQEQHSGWTAFDKAKAIAIMKKATGLSNTEIAELLGMDIQTVGDFINILQLSKRSMAYFNEKKVKNFRIISRLARLKKNIEDPKLKEQVEEAVLDKFDRQVFTDSYDITNFSQAYLFLKDEPEKQKKLLRNIIEDKNYTGRQALIDSKMADTINQGLILRGCTELRTFIKRVRSSGVAYTLSVKQSEAISKAMQDLAQYIENAKEE